jgi:GLPGLI family protein
MNNRILILFLVFFACIQCFGQDFTFLSNYENLDKYKTVDSAYIKCSYLLTFLKDISKPSMKSTDKQILLIGKHASKYYSEYALDYNYFVIEHTKKHENYPSNPNEGAWSFEFFKNYPKEKMTVTDVASMLQSNFLYEENLPVFDWRISNEELTILSYTCKKATMSFRGRNYIAWFTSEIPVANGPWKFGGLPGLILKISDEKNNFIFQCDGIEQLKKKEPVKFYQIDYKKTNREDLNKLYKRFHDDLGQYLESLGSKLHTKDGSKMKLPYNPIELE